MLNKDNDFPPVILTDFKGAYMLRDVLRLSLTPEGLLGIEEAYKKGDSGGGGRGGQQIFEYNFYKGIKLGYY